MSDQYSVATQSFTDFSSCFCTRCFIESLHSGFSDKDPLLKFHYVTLFFFPYNLIVSPRLSFLFILSNFQYPL